ncbi:MAG: hypothetical protein ACRDCC_07175, partial [Culicoidibacterales bacterium]
AHSSFVNLLAETEMTHLNEQRELEKIDVLVDLLAEAELEKKTEQEMIDALNQEHKTLINLLAEAQLEQTRE